MKQSSRMPFKEAFARIELIPLENVPESAIKEIERIIEFDGCFYVYDEEQKAVLIFSDKGKYLHKIQHIGRGPGEFTLLDDFEINRFTGDIELLNPRGELLQYDRNGHFKGSIHLPSTVRAYHKFCNLSDDIVIFYSEYESKKLSFYSRKKNDFVHQEYEIPDFIISNTPLISLKSSPFYIFSDDVFFTEGSSNKVYAVIPTGLAIKYIWDFGKNNLDIDNMKKDGSLSYYKDFLINRDFVIGLRFTCENEEYILSRFLFNKLWYTVIYNKILNEYKLISKFQEGVTLPEALTFFDQGLYTTIEPAQIQLYLKAEILEEAEKKIFENIKIEDNPVIVKYYFN